MFFVRKSKYESLKEDYEDLLKLQIKTYNQKSQLKSRCEVLTNRTREYEESLNVLSDKYKKVVAAKGGLTKENNKIRKQNSDLIQENHELIRQLDDMNIKFMESTNLIDVLTNHNKKISEEKTKLQEVVKNLNKEEEKKKKTQLK